MKFSKRCSGCNKIFDSIQWIKGEFKSLLFNRDHEGLYVWLCQNIPFATRNRIFVANMSCSACKESKAIDLERLPFVFHDVAMLKMLLMWHEDWRFMVPLRLQNYMQYAIEHEWAPVFPRELKKASLVQFLHYSLEPQHMKYLIDLWPNCICTEFDVTKTQTWHDVLQRSALGLSTESDQIWMRSARILENCIKRRMKCQSSLQMASKCMHRLGVPARVHKMIAQLVWHTRNDSVWAPPISPLEKRIRYVGEVALKSK